MAVITQAMLEDRVGGAELIRLTDDAADGAVNSDVLNQHIAEGEAEIWGYVAQRYTLPLSLADAVTLQTVSTKLMDVIVYRLYVHRDREASEQLLKLYQMAIAWAEKIAAGELGLPGETPADETPGGGKIHVVSEDAVITRETMQGL